MSTVHPTFEKGPLERADLDASKHRRGQNAHAFELRGPDAEAANEHPVQLTLDGAQELFESVTSRRVPLTGAQLDILPLLADHDLHKPLAAAVRWIHQTGRARLSARDLQRGPYVLKDSAQLCKDVIDRLAELGWASRLPEAEIGSRRPGRPASTVYEIHLPVRGPMR